jgi:hypothetical protein
MTHVFRDPLQLVAQKTTDLVHINNEGVKLAAKHVSLLNRPYPFFISKVERLYRYDRNFWQNRTPLEPGGRILFTSALQTPITLVTL